MKMTLVALVGLLAALFLAPRALAQCATDPAMFRGNPEHTGVYPDSTVPAGKVKWSFDTGNKVRSTPVLCDGTLYVGSNSGHLYALDAQSGKLKWKFQAAGAVASSPSVFRDMVFVEAGDTAIHAVDAKTGREKWTVKTGPPIPPDPRLMSSGKWEFEHSSPVIAGETLYIGSADGNVYALDTASGKARWVFKTAGRVRATPAVAEGAVFAGSMDGNLYALDAERGTLKWKFKTAGNKYFPLGEVQSTPAVGEGAVFFGARDGALYALDVATGTQLWKADQENFSWVIGGPAIYKGTVIVGTSDAQDIKAYDAKTGRVKWQVKSPEPANILASPVISGSTLYVGDFYGSMLWLNADTGKLLGGFSTDERIVSSAVIRGGVLYFGAEDDRVYALE